jgi:hypothetical protein
MKLIALVEFYYDGRTLRPGDQFECMGDTDLRVLTAPDALGGQKAKQNVETVAEPVQTMALEPETTDEPAEQLDLVSDNPQRRRYRRRDMEPES